MEWIIENKEWLFSGILISIPIALLSKKILKRSKMIQKGGKESTNIQVGGNFEINESERKGK